MSRTAKVTALMCWIILESSQLLCSNIMSSSGWKIPAVPRSGDIASHPFEPCKEERCQ